LFARLEESEPAVGAQSPRRDKREGFRSRLESTGIIEDIKSNQASAVDCVDRTGALVGHQNLTAEGPEAIRRYNWSFNLIARARRVYLNDMWSSWKVVDFKDVALVARCDQVVSKMPHR
jgi:hypothetical protein